VQQYPYTPTMSRQKEIRLKRKEGKERKKERKKECSR